MKVGICEADTLRLFPKIIGSLIRNSKTLEFGVSTQLSEIQEKGHGPSPKTVTQFLESASRFPENVSQFPENASQFPKILSWFPKDVIGFPKIYDKRFKEFQ